jgi:hypothetical protein
VIDFSNAANNRFLAVRELKIQGLRVPHYGSFVKPSSSTINRMISSHLAGLPTTMCCRVMMRRESGLPPKPTKTERVAKNLVLKNQPLQVFQGRSGNHRRRSEIEIHDVGGFASLGEFENRAGFVVENHVMFHSADSQVDQLFVETARPCGFPFDAAELPPEVVQAVFVPIERSIC